jgi:hypothetical protein
MALRERSRGMKKVLQKVEESYLPDMLHIRRADMKKRHMYGRQRAKEMRCVCKRERGRDQSVVCLVVCWTMKTGTGLEARPGEKAPCEEKQAFLVSRSFCKDLH